MPALTLGSTVLWKDSLSSRWRAAICTQEPGFDTAKPNEAELFVLPTARTGGTGNSNVRVETSAGANGHDPVADDWRWP